MQNQLFLGPPKSGKTRTLARLAAECDTHAHPFIWLIPCGMARMRPWWWNPVTQHTFSSLFGVEEDIWCQWVNDPAVSPEQVLRILKKKNVSYRWQALQEYIQSLRVVLIDNAERINASEWSLFAQLMSEITEKKLPTFFVAANLLYTPGIQPKRLHISYFFESPHWHTMFQHRPVDLKSEPMLHPLMTACYYSYEADTHQKKKDEDKHIDLKTRESFRSRLRPLKWTEESQHHILVVTSQDAAARLTSKHLPQQQQQQKTRLMRAQETDWIKWNDEYFEEYEKARSEYTMRLMESKNPDLHMQYQYHKKYAHMRWSTEYATTYMNQSLPVEKVIPLFPGARVMSLGNREHGRLGTVLEMESKGESVVVCWDGTGKSKPEVVSRATWTICCDEGYRQFKQFPLRLATAMTVAEIHSLGVHDLPLFISISHEDAYTGALYTALAHASLDTFLLDQKKPLCWPDLCPPKVVRQLLHQLAVSEQKQEMEKVPTTHK